MQVIVKLKPSQPQTQQALEAVAQEVGCRAVPLRLNALGAWVATLHAGAASPPSCLLKLAQHPRVEYAEEDRMLRNR